MFPYHVKFSMFSPLRIGTLVIGRALNYAVKNTTIAFLGKIRLPIPGILPSLVVSGTVPKLAALTPGSLLDSVSALGPTFTQPKRTHIKFSLTRGRQKTVKAVPRRFFRLHWGGWIRPMIGRHKRLWKKDWHKRQRLRRHIFCNSGQNTLLDHMVTRFWKRPKHYVDDPYEPYHVRNDIPYEFYTRYRR